MLLCFLWEGLARQGSVVGGFCSSSVLTLSFYLQGDAARSPLSLYHLHFCSCTVRCVVLFPDCRLTQGADLSEAAAMALLWELPVILRTLWDHPHAIICIALPGEHQGNLP